MSRLSDTSRDRARRPGHRSARSIANGWGLAVARDAIADPWRQPAADLRADSRSGHDAQANLVSGATTFSEACSSAQPKPAA